MNLVFVLSVLIFLFEVFAKEISIDRMEVLKNLSLNPDQTKKVRFTQSGTRCMIPFVSNGKTYFDCTTDQNPFGMNTPREWCLSEFNIDSSDIVTDSTIKSDIKQSTIKNDGSSNWGYCRKVLDFDKIKLEIQEIKKSTNDLISNATERIKKNMSQTGNIITYIKTIVRGQDNLVNQIKELRVRVTEYTQRLSNVITNASTISRMKEQLNDEKMKFNTQNEETKEQTTNCEETLGYYFSESGDGISGKYYNNESFLGNPVIKVDRNIEFYWGNEPPVQELNIYNYSVKWNGYIMAPYSRVFEFKISSDGGFRFYFENTLLLENNFYCGLDSEESDTQNSIDDSLNIRTDPFQASSTHINLSMGMKYYFELHYFHSSHQSIDENEKEAYISLYWKSQFSDWKIINPSYFYKEDSVKLIKISDYDHSMIFISGLKENDYLFMDSHEYILQDIPSKFIEASYIKLSKSYVSNIIEFSVNSPSKIIIAYATEYLTVNQPGYFTKMSMSLLLVDRFFQDKGIQEFKSSHSVTMDLFSKNYKKGNVVIQMNRLASKSNKYLNGLAPIIIIITHDNEYTDQMKCDSLQDVAITEKSEYYDSCRNSSSVKFFECQNGIKNINYDKYDGMWATESMDPNPWVLYQFKVPFKIINMKYTDRRHPLNRSKRLDLTFSSGDKFSVELFMLPDTVPIKIPPIITNSIKIELTKEHIQGQAGGSFVFVGKTCYFSDDAEENLVNDYTSLKSKKDMPSIIQKSELSQIRLDCDDTLFNTDKFDKFHLHKYKFKAMFADVICPTICNYEISNESSAIKSDEASNIFHLGSTICKAAMKANVLNKSICHDQFKLEFLYSETDIDKVESFKLQNFTISLEDNLPVDVMTELTLPSLHVPQNLYLKYHSAPGVLRKLGNYSYSVTYYSKEGELTSYVVSSQDSYSMRRIRPCGSHIMDRNCRIIKPEITVLFSASAKPKDLKNQEFYDIGEKFSLTNSIFGWTENIVETNCIIANTLPVYHVTDELSSSNVKYQQNPEDLRFKHFVKFPSGVYSEDCLSSNPTHICQVIEWKIFVGKGEFKVFLGVGSSNEDFVLDGMINGRSIQTLNMKKNTFRIINEVASSDDEGFIVIGHDCSHNCENSKLIVSFINIIRKENEPISPPLAEVDLGCNSYKEGRCLSGSSTIINCVYENDIIDKLNLCQGKDLQFLKIPNTPTFKNRCSNIIGMWKCVKTEYLSIDECTANCPYACDKKLCKGQQ